MLKAAVNNKNVFTLLQFAGSIKLLFPCLDNGSTGRHQSQSPPAYHYPLRSGARLCGTPGAKGI